MLYKWKKKLRKFHQNTDGSEVIEMVWTTMMLVCFIMIGLMLLTYVMQLTVVNTATKKVVREIEVTGQATQSTMNARFNEMLGSSDQLKDRSVSISNVSFMSGTNHIQLKHTFMVTGKCTYTVSLINPGNITEVSIDMPIVSRVSGMSEWYWGSGS